MKPDRNVFSTPYGTLKVALNPKPTKDCHTPADKLKPKRHLLLPSQTELYNSGFELVSSTEDA